MAANGKFCYWLHWDSLLGTSVKVRRGENSCSLYVQLLFRWPMEQGGNSFIYRGCKLAITRECSQNSLTGILVPLFGTDNVLSEVQKNIAVSCTVPILVQQTSLTSIDWIRFMMYKFSLSLTRSDKNQCNSKKFDKNHDNSYK